MRISDWSSDVCSSDLSVQRQKIGCKVETQRGLLIASIADRLFVTANRASNAGRAMLCTEIDKRLTQKLAGVIFRKRNDWRADIATARSEEHTSELQSLLRISYDVFCLQKKKTLNTNDLKTHEH